MSRAWLLGVAVVAHMPLGTSHGPGCEKLSIRPLLAGLARLCRPKSECNLHTVHYHSARVWLGYMRASKHAHNACTLPLINKSLVNTLGPHPRQWPLLVEATLEHL